MAGSRGNLRHHDSRDRRAGKHPTCGLRVRSGLRCLEVSVSEAADSTASELGARDEGSCDEMLDEAGALRDLGEVASALVRR